LQNLAPAPDDVQGRRTRSRRVHSAIRLPGTDALLVANGTCMKCETCGSTTGCSWLCRLLVPVQRRAKLVPYKFVPFTGQSRSPSPKTKNPAGDGGGLFGLLRHRAGCFCKFARYELARVTDHSWPAIDE
jgi:hypothetical protein